MIRALVVLSVMLVGCTTVTNRFAGRYGTSVAPGYYATLDIASGGRYSLAWHMLWDLPMVDGTHAEEHDVETGHWELHGQMINFIFEKSTNGHSESEAKLKGLYALKRGKLIPVHGPAWEEYDKR